MRIVFVLLIGLFTLKSATVLAGPGKGPAAPTPPAPATDTPARGEQRGEVARLDVEDAAEPFVPARPRSEEDDDRIEALSLFAAGRIAEQEDHMLEALRRYERAVRFDPSSQTARRQAVVTAIRLSRWNEALRYAAKGDLGIDEAGVLWELAGHFAQNEQYAEALDFYRAARALQPEHRSTAYVILSLDVGRMAYLNRNYAEASDAFAEVIKALEHPEQYGLDERVYKGLLAGKEGATSLAQLYLLFAEAFLSAERFDEAVAALDKANKVTPDAAVHAFRLARVEDAKKEPAKALALLQKYFDAKAMSEGLVPYQLLVKLLGDLGRGGEVVATLEKLAKGEPEGENQILALFLAEQYRAAEQPAQAEPLYRAALKKTPSAAAYQGLAAVLRQSKRGTELVDLLGEIAGKTHELDALGGELKAIVADTELTAAMVTTARERHKADPDSLGFGPRLAVALLCLEAERFDDAAHFFELALKVNQESAKDLYRTWAAGLFAAKRYDDGAAILQRAIDERAVATGDATFHFMLSRALAAADKFEEAIDAARHAASLAPRAPQVAGWLAQLLSFAKRYDEAVEAGEDLIRRFDDADQSDLGRQEVHRARMILSNIAVLRHDTAAAEEYLAQILDEFPEDIGAQNDLGYLWADDSKHLQRALAMIERAVSAEPENAAYRDSLGWAFYRLGRYDEAVAELKKATAGDEPDGVMLEHLGDACAAAGQAEAAAEAWHKAQAAFEKEGDADKIARVKQKLADQPAKPAAGN
ncbi:MAG TPA: tetratricopeptide repeat protein [Pirellulales bacterium]|nr:tetratricopeptide repeat protein [Pirellulales bacterium]